MASSDRSAGLAAFTAFAVSVYVVAVGLSWLGFYTTGMVLFPIPVALYIGLGKFNRSAVLLALAVAAPLTVPALWSLAGGQLALCYLLAAGVGIPLGMGLRRRWSYGWTFTATTGYLMVLFALVLAAYHEVWRAEADQFFVAVEQWFNQNLQSDPMGSARLEQGLTWIRTNWTSLGYGLLAVEVILGAALYQWLAVWLISSHGDQLGLRNPFRSMRVPEWLVWAVIGCAVLWFWDYFQDVPWARLVSWNGLIALSAVYWLNGLAVVVHAAKVWRPNPLVVFLVVVFLLLAMSTVHMMLVSLGLFDTWGEFRQKVDRLAEARAKRGPDEDDRP